MLSLFNSVKDGALKSDQVRETTCPGKTREKQRTPAALALDKTTSLQRQLSLNPDFPNNYNEEIKKDRVGKSAVRS